MLLDENRDPLQSVVALVVDRSQSQDIGAAHATRPTAALEGMKERLARFKQFEVRVVEAGQADAADDRTETRLFGALQGAFRDVPPSRIAGADHDHRRPGARRAAQRRRHRRRRCMR